MATKSTVISKKKASEKTVQTKVEKTEIQSELNSCKNGIIDGLVKIKEKDYSVAKTMVTNIQWHSVMGGEETSEEKRDYPKKADISDWYRFIETLNDSQLARDANVTFFIPNVKDWEYACRGSATKKTLPGSILDYAWFKCNSGGKLHPVAQKKPNAFGLYDMGGNLGELCANGEWYGGDYGTYLGRYSHAGVKAENLYSTEEEGGMSLFAY